VNIYIAHYHFEEISSALNALSVHLKQKWLKETFKRVQIECVIIQVRRETVPCNVTSVVKNAKLKLAVSRDTNINLPQL